MWGHYQKLKDLWKIFIAHVKDEIQVCIETRFIVTFCKLILQTLQQNLPFHYIYSLKLGLLADRFTEGEIDSYISVCK